MKVYLVHPDRCDYDQFDGLVIVAENEDNALDMVNNGGWYSEGFFKKNQGEIHIKEVDLTTEHIILESFNAG